MEAKKLLLALVIIAGYFGVLALYGLGYIQIDDDKQSILILVGGLATAFGMVVQWYFGSSEGSSRKTEMLTRKESGFSRVGMLALLAVLGATLTGCPGTVFDVRKAEIAVSAELSPVAAAAQTAINEANVTLAAAKQVIRDKAANGIVSADEAQTWLDRTRELDDKVDAAQSLLALGDPAAAKTQAEWINTAIVALQAEIAKRARETDDGGG